MALTIPKFKDLIKKAIPCALILEEEKANFDKQDATRYLSFFRRSTYSPKWEPSAHFITDIARYIKGLDDANDNLVSYKSWDQKLAQKHTADIALFLKHVIIGAVLFELASISATYAHEHEVKSKNTLGKYLLNVVGIDTLAEVPDELFSYSLEALSHFVTVMSENSDQKADLPVYWHPSLTNTQLQKAILMQVGHRVGVEWDLVSEVSLSKS